MLVVTQVALSMVLLVGAGLLGRSVSALLGVDPGFDAGRTLTFRVSLDESSYETGADLLAFSERLTERLEALPGVTAAGVGSGLPLGQDANQLSVRFPGAPGNIGDETADGPLVDVLRIGPGYAEAAGLRILSGRALARGDGEEGGRRAVLVDDVLARRFFPGGGAVGGLVAVAGDTAAIVGVVDQARLYDVHRDDRGQVYVPLEWQPQRAAHVAVRTAGDPEAISGSVRDAVHALDARLPVSEISTLRAAVRGSLRDQRMSLALVGGFAAGALLLTSLGLYGVVAGTVVRRRSEIGVRMAMGADRRTVVGMVLVQGARLVAWGLALGLVAAWAGARLLSTLLYGVSPFDPLTYAAVAATLGGVALLASWLPARAASRIAPTEALRGA